MIPIRYLIFLCSCMAALPFKASAQCNMTAIATPTHITCAGANDGSVGVEASNGALPYTYLWSNNSTTQNISGLGAGLYTCTVTDALLCTATATATVNAPTPLSVSVNNANLNCLTPYVNLTATVSGGTLPYEYSWSTTQTTPSVDAVSPGTYTVTVSDANGCTATAAGQVTQDIAVPIACVVGSYTLTCNIIALQIDAGCSSTGPNFFYQWNSQPGNIVSGQGTLNPAVDQPGVYTLTVTNAANGCTSTKEVVVSQDIALPIADAGDDFTLTCITTSVNLDGTQSWGGSNFTWTWSGPGITTGNMHSPTPNVSEPGVYTLTVTDINNGCTASDQVVVTQDFNIPLADVGPNLGLPCGGGSVTLQGLVPGGGNFTFFWSGPGITPANANFLNPVVSQPGEYTIVVVNTVNGCTATDVVRVYPGPIINPQQIVVHHETCAGNDGAVEITFTQGVAPYTYLWSNNSTLEDQQNLTGGQYQLLVTDANNCTYYADIIVLAPVPISVGLNLGSGPIPCGSPAGMLGVGVSGGMPPYTYEWSNGATGQQIFNLLPGVYTVIVHDSGNCTASFSTMVNGDLNITETITNPLCFGAATGSINLSVDNGTGPYTFNWQGPDNFSAATEDLVGIKGGQYSVTVIDAAGCIRRKDYQLTEPVPVTVFGSGSLTTCPFELDGIAVAYVFNALPPINYLWSNGQTTQTIADLSAGVYHFTVTDGSGCTYVSPDVVVTSPPEINISINPISNNCDGAVLAPDVSGGTTVGHYFFQWSNTVTDSVIQVSNSGLYTVTVTDINGCTATGTYDLQINGGLCGTLKGIVYQDIIENCQFDGEPGIGGWIMRAESANGVFYGVTQADGSYNIGVLPGDYTVYLFPPNALWVPCQLSLNAGTVQFNETINGVDFPVKKTMDCPNMWVEIASGNLRRCFSNNVFYVDYCNNGTADATGVYVDIQLDPFLSMVSANWPYTDLGNGLIRFQIGSVPLGQCGEFNFLTHLSCDAVLGQTHCTEATIYPDPSCLANNPQWSGASLRVSSQCNPDSVQFMIENVGTGNMPNALDYIVIEDQVMFMTAPIQLDAGESATVKVPANGSTWRIEVEQEPFHPGLSMPSVSVEGCTSGATFSTGFVSQFPTNDADDNIDITCVANTGSYDPNDKQAFPLGYGAQHYIRPGTPLEYMIRFQNTGNDTAFTVRIVDTLSTLLDPATVRAGSSSHVYSWDLNGAGVLSFLFENILLPDSNVNEPASHGFVKFSIMPRADAPLESVIENTGHIYFDFNDAIVTNTTFHRLGENFITVGLWQPQQPLYSLQVWPNPFAEQVKIQIGGITQTRGLQLEIFDLQGKSLGLLNSDSGYFTLQRGPINTGTYLFRVTQNGKLIGNGKLMAR